MPKPRGEFSWCEHGKLTRLPWQVVRMYRHVLTADEEASRSEPAGFTVMVPCALGNHYLIPDPKMAGHVLEAIGHAGPAFLYPTREAAEAAIKQHEQQEAEQDRQLGLE